MFGSPMNASPYGGGGDTALGLGGGRGMMSAGGGVPDLPPPELTSLPELIRVLMESSPFVRDKLAAAAMRRGYLRRLLDVFRMCEDLDDSPGCAMCAKAIKALSLLNDTQLLEALVAPDVFLDVLGALEHDPEYPGPRPNHREVWAAGVVFKEVVPIASPTLRARIHTTYRLQYLKDNALAHCLDDATFSTLASLVLFNHVEVLMALQSEPQFLSDLFARLRAAPPGSGQWSDLVAFVQEMCSMARHLQPGARGRLYSALISHGAFDVLTSVLRMPRTRVHGPDAPSAHAAAADILVAFLCHDVAGLRQYLQRQQDHVLLTLLVHLFIGDAPVADPAASAIESQDGQDAAGGRAVENGEYALLAADDGAGDDDPDGLQGHLGEIMRMLLDPEGMEHAVEKNGFLELWYNSCMDKLVAVLQAGCSTGSEQASQAAGAANAPAAAPPRVPACSTLVQVLELLCFCVQTHQYRIKYYLLRTNFLDKALRLLRARRERAVQLAAIRLVRTCVGQREEFFTRYLVKHGSLGPVFVAFIANGTRNNALNSAVLELLDYCRRDAQQLKPLVTHIVEHHGAALDGAQIDTYCGTWKALKLRHEQGQEAPTDQQGGGVVDVLTSASPLHSRFIRLSQGVSGGMANVGVVHANVNAARMRQDGSMDAREESYFDRDDDDNVLMLNTAAALVSGEQQMSGAGPNQMPPQQTGSPPPHPGGPGSGAAMGALGTHHRAALPPSSPLSRLVDYGDEEVVPSQQGAAAGPPSQGLMASLGGMHHHHHPGAGQPHGMPRPGSPVPMLSHGHAPGVASSPPRIWLHVDAHTSAASPPSSHAAKRARLSAGQEEQVVDVGPQLPSVLRPDSYDGDDEVLPRVVQQQQPLRRLPIKPITLAPPREAAQVPQVSQGVVETEAVVSPATKQAEGSTAGAPTD